MSPGRVQEFILYGHEERLARSAVTCFVAFIVHTLFARNPYPPVEDGSRVLSNSSLIVVARSRSSKIASALYTQEIVGLNPTPPIGARVRPLLYRQPARGGVPAFSERDHRVCPLNHSNAVVHG
jgi:hypothetical protein